MKLPNKNNLAGIENIRLTLQLKKCIYSILFIIFEMFALNTAAQAQLEIKPRSDKNQFRVGLGAGYFQTMDLQVSPISFQGVRKNLQLEYLRNMKKGIFTSGLNASFGSLTPTSGPALKFYYKQINSDGTETDDSRMLAVSQVGLNLEIGYLHKLHTLTGTGSAFYLGGSLEENMTGAPPFGVINYASLNAKTRFDYQLKNGKPLIFQISVPVVSVITRLPYHGIPSIPGKSTLGAFFTGNNKIETLNRFQNLRFSIKYPVLVTKRMAFDIAYEASWLHSNKPQHLTQAGSQLSLGLTF